MKFEFCRFEKSRFVLLTFSRGEIFLKYKTAIFSSRFTRKQVITAIIKIIAFPHFSVSDSFALALNCVQYYTVNDVDNV